MTNPTYYELLGVAPNAGVDEIKDAYRRLMRTAHPDRGGTSGLFRAVQLAYETLVDPVARARYDDSLLLGRDSTSPRPAGATARQQTNTTQPGSAHHQSSAPPRAASGAPLPFKPMERVPRAQPSGVGTVFDPPLFRGGDTAGSRRRRGVSPIGGFLGKHSGGADPVATDLLPMSMLRERVIGTPGGGVVRRNLTSRGAAFDREADRRTDELIDAAVLPAYPAMRLVHDLLDPASRVDPIDHAVVVGDRAIFIESVMVSGAEYRWDGSQLAGDLAPALTLPPLMETARLWLDPWQVSAVVVLHSTDGRLASPAVTDGSNGGEVRVVNPHGLVDYLREISMLEARTHVVNVPLLRAVLQLRPDAHLGR